MKEGCRCGTCRYYEPLPDRWSRDEWKPEGGVCNHPIVERLPRPVKRNIHVYPYEGQCHGWKEIVPKESGI